MNRHPLQAFIRSVVLSLKPADSDLALWATIQTDVLALLENDPALLRIFLRRQCALEPSAEVELAEVGAYLRTNRAENYLGTSQRPDVSGATMLQIIPSAQSTADLQ